MFQWSTDTLLALLTQYGYLAFFLFMFGESSMVFPFVPSEVVVPAAAELLVTGVTSFCAFVLVGTAGATLGSLFAYYVFGATSHEALNHYGRYVRVSERDIDRARYWFQRWGEQTVFWGRLLPAVRSLISIPAGFAGMNRRKFVAYSAAGSALFTAAAAVFVTTVTAPLTISIATLTLLSTIH